MKHAHHHPLTITAAAPARPRDISTVSPATKSDIVLRNRILIIGGGTAGITVAARLRRADKDLAITLVEPSAHHYYQPLWTLVGGGIVSKKITERPEASVIPRGVKWVQDYAAEFLPDENAVITGNGTRIDYDFLVVAPGIQLDWDKIPGLRECMGSHGICSNYSYETVDSTWEAVRNFRGGTAIFTMPNSAVKCGGAPQKIMYLAEAYFRKHGLSDRTRVLFIAPGANIFGIDKYRPVLEKIISERGIETLFRHHLVELHPEIQEAVFESLDTKERQTIKFDMIHVTPPMSAPDFIKRSPLADANGWVEADKFTLQHPRYPNVFSLGDASSLPTSKTGAAVRKEAPVLVKNLLAQRAGQPLLARYNGYTSCPIVTGNGRLVLAEFDYDGNPAETFPFNQAKERRSMYLLKRYLLPQLYWRGMLKGIA